jgi:hypothetical protein
VQLAIVSLEEEVAELEAQLDRARGYLESATTEHQLVVDITESASRHSLLSSEHDKLRLAAESSERKWATLQGLGKWKPATLNESQLSFKFVGPCPSASVVVEFQLYGSAPVQCKARIDPTVFPRDKSQKSVHIKSVASFLEVRTCATCALVSLERLENPVFIGAYLHRLAWMLGRLETTALELTMLQRRYKAVLTNTGKSNFQLEVDFASRSGLAQLRATFELAEAYPFSPVGVCLDVFEGQVDVEGMRKLLIKNAKPGFGYLSRTCDVISAFVR